jgi:predicted  nucleic acid-binding Zn-ribbon protein
VLTDDLLELQRIDSAIDQLAHRRAHLPERAAAEQASAELVRTTRQIADLIARQRELNDAIEAAEETGVELTRNRERLQSQLRTIISPREAEALTHELDALAARRDELDDAELANLEEQSQVVDDVAAAHRNEGELAATVERTAADLAAAEAAIDAEIGHLTVQRSEVVTRIDGGTLSDYEQRRAHLGGVAAARLDGKRCAGCHLDLSTAEVAAVKATPVGEYTDCPQCGRMLIP